MCMILVVLNYHEGELAGENGKEYNSVVFVINHFYHFVIFLAQ